MKKNKPSATAVIISKSIACCSHHSKFKDYVREVHGLNTSANVMERLSDLVRELADEAAQKAKMEGRKTLMDRDF